MTKTAKPELAICRRPYEWQTSKRLFVLRKDRRERLATRMFGCLQTSLKDKPQSRKADFPQCASGKLIFTTTGRHLRQSHLWTT